MNHELRIMNYGKMGTKNDKARFADLTWKN